ncbi:MAG: hypothetical protein IPK82_20165 [Polyangiaceae bacterium]|nr:hypothetical protein [Polyangiaceae bacterium]
MATRNLPARVPQPQPPALPVPQKPSPMFLSLVEAALARSKAATRAAAKTAGDVANAAGNSARAAGRAARAILPEQPLDIAIEESAAVASHASAHALHRLVGGVAVGVKGGIELVALVAAKLKTKSPRVLRGLRSSLRGTLHHTLGAGLHAKWPLQARPTGIQTSGVEGSDVRDAEVVDDTPGTRGDF